MKKIWLLLILTILFLTGCSEPGWNGYEKLDIPRSLRCEYFFSPDVGTDTIKTGTKVIGEFSQVTDFFNPWKRPIDRFEQIPDWKIQIVDMDAPRYSYRIKILDIECYSTDQIISPGRDWRFPVTSYHVQILTNKNIYRANAEDLRTKSYTEEYNLLESFVINLAEYFIANGKKHILKKDLHKLDFWNEYGLTAPPFVELLTYHLKVHGNRMLETLTQL